MDTSSTATAAAPADVITNVFVLMLENHSFDHVFAMSGIPGIRTAGPGDANQWVPPDGGDVHTVHVTDEAPWSMSTDPGHEFDDVLVQLCGVTACPGGHPGHGAAHDDDGGRPPGHGHDPCYPGGTYPDIDLSGFASNYAWSRSEGTGRPTTERVGDVLACVDTPSKLPVILQLATEFAVCDAWHSSLPGPTWPNRFFVHGGSSAGMSVSPGLEDEVLWETVHGFEFEHGSIFDALSTAGHQWRLYQDVHNDFSAAPSPWHQGGWISQAASLKGVSLRDVRDLRRFRDDLGARGQDGRPAYLDVPYTFIEPNFGASFFARQGDAPGPTYRGGSSQHPEDDPSGGEGLVKAVYEAIRQSPVWESSVLVVVHDEHGGFFDSVPPGPAVPPGDVVPAGQRKLNPFGFDFDRYGVRVPAVVVSPRIPRATVDHTLYDHTSILATVERWLGLSHLTERDRAANDLRHLLSLATPRTDCPETLVEPALPPDRPTTPDIADDPIGATSDSPLPGPSNVAGFLHVLLKADLEFAGRDHDAVREVEDTFRGIRTMGDAARYARRVGARLEAVAGRGGS